MPRSILYTCQHLLSHAIGHLEPLELHQPFNTSDGLEDPADHWRQQFEPNQNHGKRPILNLTVLLYWGCFVILLLVFVVLVFWASARETKCEISGKPIASSQPSEN